jgi:hypothetical protein
MLADFQQETNGIARMTSQTQQVDLAENDEMLAKKRCCKWDGRKGYRRFWAPWPRHEDLTVRTHLSLATASLSRCNYLAGPVAPIGITSAPTLSLSR